jgi:hypothetical protein
MAKIQGLFEEIEDGRNTGANTEEEEELSISMMLRDDPRLTVS